MTSPIPTRTGPRADGVLVGIVRGPLPGVTVVNLRDDEWLNRLPLVAIRTVAQGQNTLSGVRHGLLRYDVTVQSWVDTFRQDADDLDQAVFRGLYAARYSGTVAAGGRIAELTGGPGTEVRDYTQDSRISRWVADYTVGIRPA